jgi:putative endonuclease
VAEDVTAPSKTAQGRAAEDVCADFLFARGFAILGRNVRLGPLELDLVARKGPLVVIVEVRTRGRSAWAGPFASVTRTKQRRLLWAAERLFRARLARDPSVERLRIDVAAVRYEGGQTLVDYVEGAIMR